MVSYLSSLDFSDTDLSEIADLVTEIVNPGNQFKASIRYAGSGEVFLYSNSTIKKEERITGDSERLLTLGDLVEFLQDKLHELGTSRSGVCPAKFCFCKYDTELIRAHDLFWELLYRLVDEEGVITGKELEQQGAFYGLDSFQKYIKSSVDLIIFEEIVHLAKICLETLESHQLFSEHFFESCKEGNHRYDFVDRVWHSKSKNPIFAGIPLYIVDLSRCKCDSEIYMPKQAERSSQSIGGMFQATTVATFLWGIPKDPIPEIPIFPGQVSHEAITSKGFPELWMAISEIFRRFLPKGQARVIGKMQAGVRLTSTERNTKRQLRKKLRWVSKMLELWDDLEDLI